jgi:hypothetical protein
MADPTKRATETSKKFLEDVFKRRPQQGQSLKKKLGPRGKGGGARKEEPVMILQTSVPEGPAKRFKTPKTFEIFKNQIDGTKIKLKKDNLVDMKAKGGRAGYRMGGKCKLAKRGKGRAYGKNS